MTQILSRSGRPISYHPLQYEKLPVPNPKIPIRHPRLPTCSLRPPGRPPDLSPAEWHVFGPVDVNDHFSGATRVQTLFSLVFRAESPSPTTPPDATGEPVAFLQLSPASDVAATWSWGPYRGQQTLEQAKALLKAALSKLDKGPRVADAAATLVTDADVLAFRKWGYFPHFDTAQLAGGWYEKFNKL